MKIKTISFGYTSMLRSYRTNEDPSIDLERDEIDSFHPNGQVVENGKIEPVATLYLKTWKPGGRPNYSPGIACTVSVLERDIACLFPDIGEELKESRIFISREPDPDHGSCS